jgi:hypothetical protein
MNLRDEHAIETYKSLISISTEGFKALQLLNGGAAIALLAYLGQMAPKHPTALLHAKRPLGWFIAGLVLSTSIYITSYFTQLQLHNENMGSKLAGAHKPWLWSSFFLALCSVVMFSVGAFSCVDALAAIP